MMNSVTENLSATTLMGIIKDIHRSFSPAMRL